MTRKEELEARAALIAATFRDMPSRSFIYDELVKVEREVWEKAAKHFETVMFLYSNNSWQARSAVEQCANWCHDQQQELT